MRKPDPVEIAVVTVPVLIEVVCAIVFISCSVLLVVILSTPAVPV